MDELSKKTQVYYFVSGMLIAFSFSTLAWSFLTVKAERDTKLTTTNTTPTRDTGSYTSTYKVEPVILTEKTKERIKHKNQERHWTRKKIDSWNKQVKKTDQRWVQPLLRVKGFAKDTEATKIINYAYYDVSNKDMDFVLTLKAENWWFNMYQQANARSNGKREDARWLCQLHRNRHKNIVDDKRFWNSWKWQVEQCYKKYKGGTKFYWYYVRNKYKNLFYFE